MAEVQKPKSNGGREQAVETDLAGVQRAATKAERREQEEKSGRC